MGIKYLTNQILTDVKKPSVIAEFNMVKYFQRFHFIPTGHRHFANTLILVFNPAVAERTETREPGTVLWCVY